MKYCRFQFNGQAHYGLVEPVAGRDSIVRILLAPPEEADGDMESLRTRKIDAIPLEEAALLPPVRPSKIVCIGRNYREHAAELGHDVPAEPLIFLKATSALLAPGDVVRRPKISQRVDHEAELGVVIGKTCHQPPADADIRQYILGYTCVNDVTARDLQNKDGQWSRAKGFDTFCPVGPIVSDEIDPWAGVGVGITVNGQIRQQGNTRDFIFPLDTIIRHIAQAMTLFPGDLIPSGTPSGVGPVVAGDVMEVSVEGVGTLKNPVAEE
ncbi:MAG TPA: fumarylacetoacetate hydrolase family protein [Candidatus Sulfotelmatobacter sp.]|jgi:2-keto-4-pentenoate hydratase/2-oxohepta-3-ene-1,7-dioic acid hydratase in catechol pathway